MREAAFIKRNQAKWQRLEQVVDGLGRLSADEASDLYVQLNDDLSYARTFYPSSAVTTFLNGLAVKLHHHIYRNKRMPRGRFIAFWRREVPLALAEARRNLLIAFAVFAVAVGIGVISAQHDPAFVRLIMGDAYVDMTLDNIAKGTPMAVYGSQDSAPMFLGITANNIRVAMLCFAAGLFTGFGSGLLLLYNGIMVGAFQWFFHEQGVLRESALAIWMHGTLEISAIIIAGGAGLCIGNAWLYPGTYTRLESFKRGARTGLKVVMGLVPVFIAAGFIESFVTRQAGTMPLAAALAIIGTSLVAVIWYVIILPFHAEHRTRAVAPGARLQPDPGHLLHAL
jgi:uncharacterized membrane protein SpoIIM required for sporulation